MAQEKSTVTAEETVSKTAVDEAIASMETLYESLTGTPPPSGDQTYAPIPVERDPGEVVGKQLERLVRALEPQAAAAWAPPLVIWEGPNETLVCLDLPGVGRSDVEVVEDRGMVTITGQRPAAHDGHRVQLAERPMGPFRRHLLLPRGGKVSEISARLQDGVLEIRIAKEAGEKSGTRKIEVV
jgi:HSP20 family protein